MKMKKRRKLLKKRTMRLKKTKDRTKNDDLRNQTSSFRRKLEARTNKHLTKEQPAMRRMLSAPRLPDLQKIKALFNAKRG
jgi:hypothetical protein